MRDEIGGYMIPKFEKKSYPKSADFDELRYEVAAEVERHEGFEAAEEHAADEDGRNGGGGRSGEGSQGVDLVVFQFDDGGVDADGGEEFFHDVAHAAGSATENDDGVFGDEAADSGVGGFGDVDGEGRGGGRRR